MKRRQYRWIVYELDKGARCIIQAPSYKVGLKTAQGMLHRHSSAIWLEREDRLGMHIHRADKGVVPWTTQE